jgi:hypothetical protein
VERSGKENRGGGRSFGRFSARAACGRILCDHQSPFRVHRRRQLQRLRLIRSAQTHRAAALDGPREGRSARCPRTSRKSRGIWLRSTPERCL